MNKKTFYKLYQEKFGDFMPASYATIATFLSTVDVNSYSTNELLVMARDFVCSCGDQQED